MTSTGLIANPDTIEAYAAVVGRQEAALTQVHSALARIDLPADAFGKMPEAGTLHSAYTEHAQDMLKVTSELPQQIANVAQGLHNTAELYSGLEANMAKGIGELFGTGSGTGGGGDAGKTTGKIATLAGNANKYYGWVSDPETALPPLIPDNIYGPSGGLEGLLDGGINFLIDHIHPLLQMLDYVTGDSDALKAAASTWRDQGDTLNDVIRELKASARSVPEGWSGEAADQFGQFMGDVATSLSELVSMIGQTQQILDDAREQSEFAHETIVMIIREVVEWFAGNAILDLATAGAATLFEAAGTAAFLGQKTAQAEEAASKLAGVYRALERIVKAIQDMKKAYKAEKGFSRLRKFFGMRKDLDEVLDAGKLRNLRMFSDGKLAGAAKFLFGAGKHAEGMPAVLDIGKAGVLATAGVRVGMAGAIGASGVSAEPGIVGLGKGLLDGSLKDVPKNDEGAAEALGLNPDPPEAPSVQQVDATLSKDTQPPEEQSDGK